MSQRPTSGILSVTGKWDDEKCPRKMLTVEAMRPIPIIWVTERRWNRDRKSIGPISGGIVDDVRTDRADMARSTWPEDIPLLRR